MDNIQIMLIFDFVYCFIVAFMYFIKKRINNLENKLYEVLVISNLIGLALEFFCGILIRNNRLGVLTILINKLHIMNIILWITIFTIYIVTTCFGESKIRALVEKKNIDRYVAMYILFLDLRVVLVKISV